jgi:phytoene desaturase
MENPKPMKKVVIIGAGTAGLAAGIRLRTLGFDVEIVEKNGRAGGRMYRIEDRGFRFDVGPTIVMMPSLYEEVFSFSGADPKDYIRMRKLDPMYGIRYPDGTELNLSNDLTKLVAQLERFGSDEVRGYLAYLADVYDRYTVARDGFIGRSFRKPTDFYNPRTLRDAMRLRTLNSAYSSISRFVKDEKLRQALSFQTLYIGISPFVGPSIYTIIPMIELLYGIWYIEGGMYAMTEAMERRFRELGGTMRFDTPVDRILIEDGAAVGVAVTDGRIDADIVLSNADFPFTMRHLVAEDRYRDGYTDRRLDRMEYSSSSFLLYLGLDRKYPTNVHSFRYTNDFRKNIDELFGFTVPEDPSFYLYSPSQIDPSVAPEGKETLYVLVPVPSLHRGSTGWTKERTERYRERILDLVAAMPGFGDIREHIEVSHVFTPETFRDTFNLEYGATFGFRPTLLQSNYFRPQAVSRSVRNLYFAGSSNHPGAGVPIVLTGARLATEEILKDHPGHE